MSFRKLNELPPLERSFSPLSPSSMSFLKGTLSSPIGFPSMLTPCPLDSPFETPDANFGRTWTTASLDFDSNEQPGFDGNAFANELHELLQDTLPPAGQVTEVPNLKVDAKMPRLSSYYSDNESPDNSPASSDVEDASPKHSHGTRRRSKRSFRELANGSSSLFALDRSRLSDDSDDDDEDYNGGHDHVVPLDDMHIHDEFVQAALAEDTKDAKLAAFPKLMEKAREIFLEDRSSDLHESAVKAVLSAFTKNDKTGRPLPRACQELLQRATEEVSQTRKRQRESKSHRRSLLQNQVDDSFVCPSPGCDKRYTTAEGLRLHIRNHHDVDKRWICHAPDCTTERAFVRQADLRMHLIRMHSPVRPFPCRVPSCAKTFACHSELRRHIAGEHVDIIELVKNDSKSKSK